MFKTDFLNKRSDIEKYAIVALSKNIFFVLTPDVAGLVKTVLLQFVLVNFMTDFLLFLFVVLFLLFYFFYFFIRPTIAWGTHGRGCIL